jgi:cysteinyl-tRNA synthetase
MPQIISYIEDLVKNGSAYVADGDVYFRISSIEGYGELSGNTPEQLLNGARIEVNSKRNPQLTLPYGKRPMKASNGIPLGAKAAPAGIPNAAS